MTREAPSSCKHSLKTEIQRYHSPTHTNTHRTCSSYAHTHIFAHTPLTARCYHREDEGIPGTERRKVQPAASSLRAQRKPYISVFIEAQHRYCISVLFYVLHSAVAAKINRKRGKETEKQVKSQERKRKKREEAARGTLTHIYRNGGLKSFNGANTVEMMDYG